MLKREQLAACVRAENSKAIQTNHLVKSPSSISTKLYPSG
jgi:hypothetical protein